MKFLKCVKLEAALAISSSVSVIILALTRGESSDRQVDHLSHFISVVQALWISASVGPVSRLGVEVQVGRFPTPREHTKITTKPQDVLS